MREERKSERSAILGLVKSRLSSVLGTLLILNFLTSLRDFERCSTGR